MLSTQLIAAIAALLVALLFYGLRAISLRNRRTLLAYDTVHALELLIRLLKREPNNRDYRRWVMEGNPTELYSKIIHQHSIWGAKLGGKFRRLSELCACYKKLAQTDTFISAFAQAPVSDTRKIDEMNNMRKKHDQLAHHIDELVAELFHGFSTPPNK